ncbi:HEAT repeat domain-containing protein [Methylocucumis oryzae]|uniref:PBS lyase n=1 Tax=Methylocucumis oryzae TaxID=1632867 RepID=A0A0F3IJZ5_9GAMM|nr:HEAT repeat domain-containing protein [Methylocucumis oryzae]KJV05884.1 hypothetical protein VZ94_14880 [Methylocucumis oryzae]
MKKIHNIHLKVVLLTTFLILASYEFWLHAINLLNPPSQSQLSTLPVKAKPTTPKQEATRTNNLIIKTKTPLATGIEKTIADYPTTFSGIMGSNLGKQLDASETKSIYELLAAIEASLATEQSLAQIRASEAFQHLILSLPSDPSARKYLFERLLQASGTPMAELLAQALAQSSGGHELAEIRSEARRLLNEGTSNQHSDILKFLGQSRTIDAATQKAVLELITKNANNHTDLTLDALNALNFQSKLSAKDKQNIVDTITSLALHQDATIRQASIDKLAALASHDEQTLQVLTEATHDSVPEIRERAIIALGQSQFDSQVIQTTMQTVLADPEETANVKAAAQQVLLNLNPDS